MKKEAKKPVYIMCPRCELNYIDKKDKYCNVCKAEMGLLDAAILIPEDEEELGLEKLCPACRVNYIGEDEEICFLCQKEKADKESFDDSEENWKIEDEDEVVVDDEIDLGIKLDDEELEEEESADEEFNDSDDIYYDDDDFEDVEGEEDEYFEDEDEDYDDDEDDDDF